MVLTVVASRIRRRDLVLELDADRDDGRLDLLDDLRESSRSMRLHRLRLRNRRGGAEVELPTRRGEKQLSEFLTAVDGLKIANLSYQVFNNVITPGPGMEGELSGFVYTRNVVFTIRQPEPRGNPVELDRLIAQLEDLGARYNSHCVTCVGSG